MTINKPTSSQTLPSIKSFKQNRDVFGQNLIKNISKKRLYNQKITKW